MTSAVLALGSNQGNSVANVLDALDDLRLTPGITELRASGLRESVALTPTGLDETLPRYINAVAVVDTTLSPRELLHAVLDIEARHGRVRDEKWGPRTLDIDVIAYADQNIVEPDLTIPHPEAHRRSFVLEPWLDVDKDALLVGFGRVADLIDQLPIAGLVLVDVDAHR